MGKHFGPQTKFSRRSKRLRSKGQSLIEFGLALPLLLFVILGLIETARLVYTYSAVTTASREGARYGFSLGVNGMGVPHYQDCGGIREAAMALTSIAGIEEAGIVISYDGGPGTAVISSCPLPSAETGTRILVKVTTSYKPIVPLVNLPPIEVTSTSKRTLLVNIDAVQ
ncbi:MAG TPA: pilus assembly protein [Anaerolineae bacterium]|nr:pilus assembly protein [Anaerolineae bacterium]